MQPGEEGNPNISSPDLAVVDILRNNFGFKLKDKSLESHLARAPQGSEPGELSSLSESVSAPKSELQSLIDVAKYKMGFFTRCLILLKTIIKCLIWVKTIISRDYGLEFAKQVLNKLIQTCKSNGTDVISGNVGFLKAAFSAIASPENENEVAGNIKHLLRLSKGKIATKDIIDEFKNIGDVDRRIEFLCKLQKNLSKKEKTKFKDFLEGALDGIADQIADEFEKSQDEDKDKNALLAKLKSVDSLRIALLAEGKVGVPFLAKLMNDNKLPSLKLTEEESKKLLDTLVNCGDTGRNCLEKLINEDKLQSLSLGEPSESKKFACDLLEQGPSGLAVVKALIRKGKLELRQFKDQDVKEFAEALLKCGQAGSNNPDGLINDNKLSDLMPTEEESKNLLDTLVNCGATGMNCLAELINEDKLQSLSLGEPSESKKFACDLLEQGPSGLAVVKALIRKGKLDLRQFQDQDIKGFAEALLKCGQAGSNNQDGLINDNKLPSLKPAKDESKKLLDTLVNCGDTGMNCLAELINEDKLPHCPLLRTKKFAHDLLGKGPSGLAVIKALIGKDKLYLKTDTEEFVNEMLKHSEESRNCLAELINGNMLPILSLGEPSESKKFACDLLEQGPSGLAVVKALIKAGKLNTTNFSSDEAKEFAEALLANSSSGADYVIDLINRKMLPELESQDEVKTRASQFKELYSTFERGITKAFLGETSNVDGESWEIIRSQLGSLTLARARGIWLTIANEVAASCFDENGNVDIEKLKGWMAFLRHEEIFKKPPYCFIPHTELMRSQMHTVCESLFNNQSQASASLNAAKGIRIGQHGRTILDTMSNGKELTPAVAILSSMFTPHRQGSLPTCTINSLINAEIRNHPERLIEMYGQMLESDQFTLPSGYAIRQQEIAGGFITVDLTNGGDGKNLVFRAITSGDTDKVKKRKERWLKEGITYPESGNPEDKYKLRLPVHNMNDILFAHFFQASRFGNRNIDDDGYYGTMFLYAGHKEYSEIHSPTIFVGGSNFSNVMEELIRHAKEQQQLRNHYMRVKTITRKRVIVGGNDHCGHAENIDINALLALDLNNMEIGKIYPIGDRNWSGDNTSHDIPRLAIRRVSNTPTYEFGTLWHGSKFERTDIEKFDVYTTRMAKLKREING